VKAHPLTLPAIAASEKKSDRNRGSKTVTQKTGSSHVVRAIPADVASYSPEPSLTFARLTARICAVVNSATPKQEMRHLRLPALSADWHASY